ncbi:hypothetical protein CLPUN_24500 [Clostridium puniceum]|uniref:Uncharacterized protein n=1 Tax=Clostridium puniceum TaxID=29367 RepID=A0A1S8TIA7_9CLOT|nr:hypothetical protein CLPUN_24500 [Clostridium puniceum]
MKIDGAIKRWHCYLVSYGYNVKKKDTIKNKGKRKVR